MAVSIGTSLKGSNDKSSSTNAAGPREDRRVRRTKQALRSSLVRLMRNKSLSDITTSELCRTADLNRNTFYAHYKSPMDVFEEIADEYFETISALMRDLDTASLFDVTCAILQATKSNRMFALVLTQGAGSSSDLARRLWGVSREHWFDVWDNKAARIPEHVKERVFTFAANGYTASLIAWVLSGMHEDIEDLARTMTDMSIAAIRAGLQRHMPSNSTQSA
ncbi:hypothetical protein GMI68_09580 [Eggerthellaceae bacterium zg-886]|uniref:HTH tetR-type domain-containing protein n=1 Tax=Xiamenia xianingshaonis TaxID=2682776 RepID=A0ABX0IPD5_9ACTN|nr:hypothetical protein [Xiamenia xianingshaonis]